MICISIGHSRQFDSLSELEPDLIELRFDLIGDSPRDIVAAIPTGCEFIATCRPNAITPEKQIQILSEAIEFGARYIDIEIESEASVKEALIAKARQYGVDVIISYHNYENTPDKSELLKILHDCFETGADVAKLACMVSSVEDNANLLSLYSEKKRMVILGMGEIGKISRLAALHLGAEFTFASLGASEETAPGQLSVSEFEKLNTIF